MIRKAWWRELARLGERITGRPWQISEREARQMIAILKQERCRLAHVFAADTAVHWLPLLRRLRPPLVISLHGADLAGAMTTRGYAAARGEVFARATLVACRSRDLMKKAEEAGCPPSKLRLMPAVLPKFPPSDPRPAPPDGAWQIVQAGRLIPKKGCSSALRAFAAFRREFPRARLVFAGEGPLRRELEHLAADLGVGEAVEFAGFLQEPALRELFLRSHIVMQPSEEAEGDREGVPNALLEAMGCALAPVATRHGGILEAIRHEREGLLAGEGDAEELAAALLRLGREPGLYLRLAEAARRRVLEEFAPERATAQIQAIYAEAADCA